MEQGVQHFCPTQVPFLITQSQNIVSVTKKFRGINMLTKLS